MRLTVGGNCMGENEAAQIAPLALAYIGDCVFDMYVRTHLVTSGAGGVGAMHRLSSQLVNARAQSAFAHKIWDGLTEREKSVFLRGRNAKSATVPKNMSVSDYHYATAVEAVVGYLYLTGQSERLEELFGSLQWGKDGEDK